MKRLDSPLFYRSIVIIGCLALIGSGWIVYRSIIGATAFSSKNTANSTNTVNSTTNSAGIAALRLKDTDGDSISDYDELYSSKTSPYLKDTDGDGTADGVEVDQNSDPNCPKGKTCEGFRLLTSITDSTGNLTPEFLRQALASAGVSQATLDATDDASLLSIYQQAIKSQGTTNTNTTSNTSTTNTTTNTSTSSMTLAQLQNLTPTAIRQLLIQNGLDEATINTVDDATIKDIFQQAISSTTQ